MQGDDDRKVAAVLNAAAQSRQVKRAVERGHRRKLFDGKTTAQDLHREMVFKGERCAGCKSTKVVQAARVFYPMDELVKMDAEGISRSLITNPDHFASCCVEFRNKDGTRAIYVRVSTSHSCAACASIHEREAAKLPSWAVVEFDRGPGEDKVVVGWDGEIASPPKNTVDTLIAMPRVS